MGQVCSRSSTQNFTNTENKHVNQTSQQNSALHDNQIVINTVAMEMVLGASDTPLAAEEANIMTRKAAPVTAIPRKSILKIVDDQFELDKSPKVVLLPHQHTLFCERKQRVCTAVGKCQELEIIKVVGLENQIKGSFIRSSSGVIPENISSFQYSVIPQSESGKEYKLSRDDVGFYIGYLVDHPANTKQLRKGNGNTAFVMNLIGPVLPGPPRIVEFKVAGNMTVGGHARADAHYIGGFEGTSQYWWMRVTPAGKRTQITEPRSIVVRANNQNNKEDLNPNDPRLYLLTAEDVGCTLKAKIRPVRSDGVEGEIFTSKSSQTVTAR